jgi:ABC-type antimicrobial peptide transport system permease subunit
MGNWRIPMSETAFPVNDLFRRKLQTGLTITSLTVCVASTLFLLMFSGQIGFGIAAVAQDTLTTGTSNVFSQFLTFVGILIFAVGAVIVAFIVFLMMAQRTKDYGLMKATGCPNSLVFGYFMTELLGVTFIGCVLGVVVGIAVDYAVINMSMFQIYNKAPNFWFVPLVFVAYFVFALIFGAKPILDAARMSPMKAISSVQYFRLAKGTKLKPLSKTGLTIRIASRSLFRRQSATVRVVVFLSVVFILLTVSIAGGLIASDTSTSWVQKATGNNVILIANSNMATQYNQLLLTFSGAKANLNFNYSDPQLSIPDQVYEQLNQIQGLKNIDSRLVFSGTIHEISGFTVDPDTLSTVSVGDSRQCESIIVGVNAAKTVSEPFTRGQFLNSTSKFEAVVGDSIAQTIYKPFKTILAMREQTITSDALQEGVQIESGTFKITGVCLDPLNNGNVTYVPLEQLENITGIYRPNILLVSVASSSNYSNIVNQIQTKMHAIDPGLTVLELNSALKENVNFLNSIWSVILYLPAFALAAATLCLISFHMLTIDEQHQEFAVLRATGAKPNTIIAILAVQSLTVLLASFAVGASLGTILCILILTANPVVSTFTVITISVWLLAALTGMFLLSLYPAVKFARKPLLEIMS